MKYITPYIASQCPSAGGNAVFQARGVLSLLGYTPDFDDYDLCALAQSPWRQSNVATENSFAVYPNPTTGEVFVQYGLQEVNQHWTICDMLGKQVAGGVLSDTYTEKIDISGNPSGIYLLRVGTHIVKIILD